MAGLFDSGVGGLTVLRALHALRPDVRALVVADQAHVPYGGRPLSQIRQFALAQCEFLLEQGVAEVWMACNICSAVALEDARARFGPHPIYGVLQAGCQEAVAVSTTGRIGVLATEGTVRSGAYERFLLDLLPSADVRTVPCPEFVPLVEAGRFCGAETDQAVRRRLAPLVEHGCDVIVHGCTHYPFLQDALTRAWPAHAPVRFVDPAQALVRQAAGPLPPGSGRPVHRAYTSGCPNRFRDQLNQLIPDIRANVNRVTWTDGRLQIDEPTPKPVPSPRGA